MHLAAQQPGIPILSLDVPPRGSICELVASHQAALQQIGQWCISILKCVWLARTAHRMQIEPGPSKTWHTVSKPTVVLIKTEHPTL